MSIIINNYSWKINKKMSKEELISNIIMIVSHRQEAFSISKIFYSIKS